LSTLEKIQKMCNLRECYASKNKKINNLKLNVDGSTPDAPAFGGCFGESLAEKYTNIFA
jgi:hypothetical protein